MAFGSPQDVEVLVERTWVPGSMLGWRHDDTGACEAWVRLRADVPGVVEGAGTWVALTDVRLPERHLSVAPGAAAARGACRSRRHGADVTAEQPAVGAGAAGRHRAPAGSVAGSAAGRHRAVTMEMPAVAGGPAEGVTGQPDATVVAPAVGGPAVAAPATEAPAAGDHDMLTRPIRLGDLVPSARGGRPPVRPSA